MTFRADLHCHSHCSDGSMSPLELLQKAHEIGLQGLSITDHDTIQAYDEVFFEKARSLNLLICSGVEFSCQLQGESVHVLGYHFDVRAECIQAFCQRHQIRRKERNAKILKKLRNYQMIVTEEELAALPFVRVVGRPHIAHIMVKKGYVASIKEAFAYYLGDGKKCFDAGEPFSVDETLEIIHLAKGKAFIAHPHLIKKRKVIKELFNKPFDGLEAYYALFHKSDNEKWVNKALAKDWLISGGSDFHGEFRPFIPLGASWVDEKAWQAIVSS